MSNLNLDSLNNQEPSTPPIVAKRTTINTSSRRGSSISSRMSSVSSSNAEDSLKSYRLVEALRSGDPNILLPLLSNFVDEQPIRRGSIVDAASQEGFVGVSSPLHLAVKVSKYSTVELVFQNSPNSVNSQDSKGSTPLHLAAMLSRLDVVTLFLSSDIVDDTIKDINGRTCLDLAGNSDIAGAISMSRANYNETYLALLAAYVASPSADLPIPAPHNRLSSHLPSVVSSHLPSVSAYLPSVVSSSPKIATSVSVPPSLPNSPSLSSTPISAASGHVSNAEAEKLYHFIAGRRSRCLDFSARDNISGSTILHEAARRKDLGIIKLVVARGGDVLVRDRKGKLAVEVAKDERIKIMLKQTATSEGNALKAASGSTSSPISPVTAQPPTMRGYLSKWTNMARGYRSRWFVLDNGILSYYRSQEDEGKASRGAISMTVASVSAPGEDKLKFEVSNKLGKAFPSFFLKGLHPVEVMRWVEVLRQNIEHAREIQAQAARAGSSSNSTYASSISDNRRASIAIFRHTPETSASSSAPSESYGERDGSIIGDDETFNGEEEGVPRAEDFELLANSTKTQLELTQQLLDSLIVPSRDSSNSSEVEIKSPTNSLQSASAGPQDDIKIALKDSLVALSDMYSEFVDVVAQRERYFVRKYEREIDAKRLWEENMKEIATSHAAMELELQKVGRDNIRRKKALQEVRANLVSTPTGTPLSSVSVENLNDFPLEATSSPTSTPAEISSTNRRTSTSGSLINPRLSTISIDSNRSRSNSASSPLSPGRGSRLRSGTMHTLNPIELEQIVDSALIGEADEDSDDEDEEEFFEAIESGSLPIVEAPTSTDSLRNEAAEKYLDSIDVKQYAGYEHLRTKLPIENDNRPPTSLWAILKSSIGKDLTKISFPVFFNESNSMLQRMSEDLEFSECLDSAAASTDPIMRIAFVAAFAMSNYSSTVGRIAKPFNPMLGETFEYVDLKKKYRYISEQVVHHPPISACIAQAPTWEYFGEVDAKSKFLGKSFEIRPTGVAHVNLRLPKEVAPNYPLVPHIPNLVSEHYSWTKVTTSVSNFLFGNPIIDHYGDMVITNHRTGDTCTLTFKPRGWRGSGACEIKGKVVDANGKEQLDIAGKWNSQLVARKVGTGQGELSPDAPVDGSPTYVRLWKNSEKPAGVPFNLTPFAITLNDTNPDIKEWLPPTDCRLRPDQHAFESGLYEKANDLKTELEEHQRETRRKRERGELPQHTSRWFTRKTDKDTNETFWAPTTLDDGSLEYWEERKRVGVAKKEGKEASWTGVDPIFADL